MRPAPGLDLTADIPIPSGRINVLGVGVSPLDEAAAVRRIGGWIDADEREYVCVTGVHGVMESYRDDALRCIHNLSGMVTPDGKPMVWAGRYAGSTTVGHVRGSDLMLAVCAEAERRGWSMYFYGGADGVPEQLIARLVERFPALRVAGHFSPPFRPLSPPEKLDVVRRINDAAPALVWVGLSTPKQERWMYEFRPLLNAPVLVGVGAAFDMNAGLLPQAPRWMSRTGLEWLYRLLREPRRLWRRYFRNNPAFLAGVLRRRPHVVDLDND